MQEDIKDFLALKSQNKHARDTSSDESHSDDDDECNSTKKMRKGGGDGPFERNMARKSVHGHAPPKTKRDFDR